MDKYEYNAGMNQRLYDIRTALGKTQKEIGKDIGVTGSHYSHMERTPGTFINEKTVITICSVLKVNREYLIHGKGPMFDAPSIREAQMSEVFSQLKSPFQDLMLNILCTVYSFAEGMNGLNRPEDAGEKDGGPNLQP